MKPVAHKYCLEEVPSEKERWQALPLEVRLQAVVDMALFWARLQGKDPGKIEPVARKRPLIRPGPDETVAKDV
ncbi:MAG: hypothetical protein RMK51_07330 [Meiothermus sp.]|uniref:hypothetical protein n=1 Tax=Meiothermus sp. TaxID=1955249 RepID=UPI0025CC69AD|nr:hypothetical protein [Meiothermus sp.]MCS7068093.1 hypothetical protein [Meiothermus sp.]MDW8425728.1 hypothetical protein [Meiothermus sp.]